MACILHVVKGLPKNALKTKQSQFRLSEVSDGAGDDCGSGVNTTVFRSQTGFEQNMQQPANEQNDDRVEGIVHGVKQFH